MQLLKRRLRFIWLYLRRRTPWDTGIVPPEIVSWVENFAGSPGYALDVGCGTGTTSRYLAQQGWHTVGLDFAPNIVFRARREARRQRYAGSVTFASADVSRPGMLEDTTARFDLVVDIGCLHGIPAERQPGYAYNLVTLLKPGGTYLLYAFRPEGRWADRGIDLARISVLFGDALEIVEYVPGEDTATTPHPSAWYTLRRRADA